MDEFETTKQNSASALSLELELEEDEVVESEVPNQAELANEQSPGQPSPFATKGATQPPSQPQASPPQDSETPDEPEIIFYEPEEKRSLLRPLIYSLIFGSIGALLFAGASVFYFSLGARAGIVFVIFFSALGARLAAENTRGNAVRWHAAITTGVAAIASRAMLVLILFHMQPNFSAEDLTTLVNPGKASGIYGQQSILNALSPDGVDGQQRLNERFAEDQDELDSLSLSFVQVFPKLFQAIDFFLILIAMAMTFKFAGSNY